MDAVAFTARADHQDGGRAVSGTHEHVVGPRWAVDEVPRAEQAFLVVDDHEALAAQDQEVLLGVLAMVLAGRLTRLQHVDVDADLREPGLGGLEPNVCAGALMAQGGGVGDVDDKPLRHGSHTIPRLCTVGRWT